MPSSVDAGADGNSRDTSEFQVTSLRIEPSTATLASINGSMPTEDFNLIATYANGTEFEVSNPTFTIQNRTLGVVHPDTGLFTASGTAAGSTAIVGTMGDLTAMATVNVTIERQVLGTGVGPSVPAMFDGATAVADMERAASLRYPLNNVVFPQTVYAADVQWQRTAPGDYFRIKLTKADLDITAYVAHTPERHWLVDENAWRTLAASSPGVPASLEIARFEAATGQVITEDPISITFVPVAVNGAVYYWDIVAGRIRRIRDGAGTFEDFMPTPPMGNGSNCIGCHSVSRSGRYMAGRLGGGLNVGTVFDLTQDLTPSPAPSQWDALGQQQYWWFSAWNPDDTRMVVATQQPTILRLFDPAATGGTPSMLTTSTTPNGTQPDWSPDGTTIAFVSENSHWGAGFNAGNISTMPVNGDDFGPVTQIHNAMSLSEVTPGGGNADSYPSWSPDSQRIAFSHGGTDRSEHNNGNLYIMGRDGSSVVPLAAANGSNAVNFQPRFSPFADQGYFWLSFLSRRVYGNTAEGGFPPHGNAASEERRRQQIWVTAIRADAAPGEDPSAVAYWLPGQNPRSTNISAYWAPIPCREQGEGCDVGADCCSGECADDGGTLVCSPPPPDRCRQNGESCSEASDCCDSTARCENNLCVSSFG